MCGILAILTKSTINKEALKKLEQLVSQRGPDFCSHLIEHRTKCGLSLKIIASVLHLRGSSLQKQPVIDKQGNILLFNGHIYEVGGLPLEDLESSDTQYLSERLASCDSREDVIQILQSIDGPFAIAYWHEKLHTFYLAKDIFGRKTLCLLQDDTKQLLAISSIGSAKIDLFTDQNLTWKELDPEEIYCLDYSDMGREGVITIPHVTHINHDEAASRGFFRRCPLNYDSRLPHEIASEEHLVASTNLEKKLIAAISRRIRYNRGDCLECRLANKVAECEHSKVLVAFSGGIDSTLIAMLLDRVVAKGETIDLTTVAFKQDSPDRESVASAFCELRNLCPERNWRLIISDVSIETLQTERERVIQHLILPRNTVIDDSLGCACYFIGKAEGRALDSAISNSDFQAIFDSFIKFNTGVSEELSKYNKIRLHYKSPATMLFCGSGIDEQLGGYSSHKSAWTRTGSEGVCKEIERQMLQLPFRNLGRDDRVYSHHGRDVKLPYLDYDLVSFLNQLPVGIKMNLDATPDIGPKKVLRDLAFRLGLVETSRRVKRALQFGTRIAKLEAPNEKGSDICDRLSR